MTKSGRAILVLAGTIMIGGGNSADSRATTLPVCKPCVNSGCTGGACMHEFRQSPCSRWPLLDCLDCSSGNGCHADVVFGSCAAPDPSYESPHTNCSGGAFVEQDSLQLLERLAAEGDEVSLARIADAHGNVEIDELRHAVNVRNCNNQLIAHLPIAGSRQAKVTSTP